MKRAIATLAATVAAFIGVARADIAEPQVLELTQQSAPALRVYQANRKTFSWTVKQNGQKANLTGYTPWMYIAASNRSSSIVTSACAVVVATNGTFNAVWSSAMLNTNGTWIYGVGYTDTNGTTTARQGVFVMTPDPFATGASPLTMTTNINAALYNWLNAPWVLTTDFATYTQNVTAAAGDITAVNITAGTGLTGTVNTASGAHTQTLALTAASIASLALADSALQAGATQGLVTASVTNGILTSAKAYTDGATNGLVTASITNGLPFLPLAGGTMTGPIAMGTGTVSGSQALIDFATGRAVFGNYGFLAPTIAATAWGAQQRGNFTADSTIGAYAYGAGQMIYGDSATTLAQIGANAAGAHQFGTLTGPSLTMAINDGAGAIQLFALTSGQTATTTAGGAASLLLGAGTVSNKNAGVFGDGQASHGDGSVSAGGGFWDNGTNLYAQIASKLSVESDPVWTNALAQGFTSPSAITAYTGTRSSTNAAFGENEWITDAGVDAKLSLLSGFVFYGATNAAPAPYTPYLQFSTAAVNAWTNSFTLTNGVEQLVGSRLWTGEITRLQSGPYTHHVNANYSVVNPTAGTVAYRSDLVLFDGVTTTVVGSGGSAQVGTSVEELDSSINVSSNITCTSSQRVGVLRYATFTRTAGSGTAALNLYGGAGHGATPETRNTRLEGPSLTTSAAYETLGAAAAATNGINAAFLAAEGAATGSQYYAGTTTYVSNGVAWIGTNAFGGTAGTTYSAGAHIDISGGVIAFTNAGVTTAVMTPGAGTNITAILMDAQGVPTNITKQIVGNGCTVIRTNVQTLADSTYTTILFNHVADDALSEYATSNGFFTAQIAGVYEAFATVGYQPTLNAGTAMFVTLRRNNLTTTGNAFFSAQICPIVNSRFFISCHGRFVLAVGDTINCMAYQDEGGNNDIYGQTGLSYTWMTISRVR
jgi:hypothetical protein